MPPVSPRATRREPQMRTSRDDGADTEVARLLRRVGVGTYVSQREFARLCGVSHETVSRLLRATSGNETRRPPTKATLDALARGAGLEPSVVEAAVLADYGYEQAVTGVAGVESVLAQLRGMSDADQRTVLAALAQEIATGGNARAATDGHREQQHNDSTPGGATDDATSVRNAATGS